VVPADHVAIGRDQRVAADPHPARREQLTVEADVRPVPQLDVPVLARQYGVATDEDAVADGDPLVARSLGVEQAVVVDDDVVTDADFPWMTQHHVLAEDDAAAAGAEQRRIQQLPQREPQRPGHALRPEGD
jgi:hypothetical protein